MSVFNCSIKFKVVEGNSFTTTYNKLLSQGFIDKNLNLKVDVATWRRGRSEMNEEASTLLRREVNLFREKTLLSGIRIVPDMKEFGIIDMYKRQAAENTRKQFLQDAEHRAQYEVENNLGEEIDYGERDVVDDIYDDLNQVPGTLIDEQKVSEIRPQLERLNAKDRGKVLSLREISKGKYLINTEYKDNYLYRSNDLLPLQEESEMFTETNSNTNFNLPCI